MLKNAKLNWHDKQTLLFIILSPFNVDSLSRNFSFKKIRTRQLNAKTNCELYIGAFKRNQSKTTTFFG